MRPCEAAKPFVFGAGRAVLSQVSEKWSYLGALRLHGCGVSIPTTCVLWDMVHILHVADEMRFGEPLPSGWEYSSSVY